MSEDSFDRLVAMLDYTMLVVTTRADGHNSGCLVGFATQTSFRPPRFLIGISKRNHTFGVACQSEHLAVHVLARRDMTLARLFGGQTGDNINKFERCSWHSGPEGMPILDDAVAWFVGKTLKRVDVGDHVAYLLEPVAGHADDCSDQLITFSDVHDLLPGHEA